MAKNLTRPILWNYCLSSASWRVRIALNLKNIDYEYRTVDIVNKTRGAQHSEEFTKLNPNKQVPVLFIDNNYLVQSLPIIEYINETRPGKIDLFPKKPVDRARARAIAEIINSGIQPYQNIDAIRRLNKELNREKRNEWLDYYLNKGLNSIEITLKQTSGKCCVGDEVTIADLCLVPQIESAIRSKKAIQSKIEMSNFPLLMRVNSYLENIPEFQKAHAYNQPDFKK